MELVQAHKIYNDEHPVGVIALWDDGHVTLCLGDKEGNGTCYTTSKPMGEGVYHAALALLVLLGHKTVKAD